MPFGVPVWKNEHRSALRGFDWRLPTAGGGPEACVNGIVLRPGGFDGTGEREDVFGVEVIVRGRSRGVPVAAVLDGILGIGADEGAGIGVIRHAADVLETPLEGLDAAVVVGGPAAVLIAADFALEEVHGRS